MLWACCVSFCVRRFRRQTTVYGQVLTTQRHTLRHAFAHTTASSSLTTSLFMHRLLPYTATNTQHVVFFFLFPVCLCFLVWVGFSRNPPTIFFFLLFLIITVGFSVLIIGHKPSRDIIGEVRCWLYNIGEKRWRQGFYSYSLYKYIRWVKLMAENDRVIREIVAVFCRLALSNSRGRFSK